MRLPPVKALVIAMLPLLPAAVMLAQAPPAIAQIDSREGIALRDQILELRQEVDALRAQVGSGGGSYLGAAPREQAAPAGGGTSDIVAQMLDRTNTLEDDIRNLRGRVDELQNDDQQKIADLGKKLDDLKFEVEHPGTTAPGATGPAAGPPVGNLAAPRARPPEPPPPARRAERPAPAPRPPAPAAAPAGHRPTGPLRDAYTALDRRDYPAAERTARAVLALRAGPNAYDAQFVLAEALAGQHQWSRAAIAYDDAYNRSKHGAHAPAALLGLAESLAAINEHRAACETLTKLHAQYPRQGTALKTQADAVAHRARCG